MQTPGATLIAAGKRQRLKLQAESAAENSVANRCLYLLAVYATTAANPSESSYACYYDEERSTYLGDWYSVNWMEDSDVVSPPGGWLFS